MPARGAARGAPGGCPDRSRRSDAARASLEATVRLYDTCARLRFTARRLVIEAIARIRDIALECGRRFAAGGLLASHEEIAFLELEELRDFLVGSRDAHEVFARDTTSARSPAAATPSGSMCTTWCIASTAAPTQWVTL